MKTQPGIVTNIKMKKEACSFAVLLLVSLQAAAQSSLFLGAGPSVNHISMDVAPASIPNFDALHRLSVNAEVLYGYHFPNRWQVLAGAGVLSFKYGVEAGHNIQPHKASFPHK